MPIPSRDAPADSGTSCIDAVRRFNRFYTRLIGILQDGLLASPFSLTEARVLYEVARREQPTATDLVESLGIDAGYLSRILSRLRQRGLVEKTPSYTDGRQGILSLTAQGRAAFIDLDEASRREVAALLAPISADHQRQLIEAMHTIEAGFGAPVGPERGVLRPPVSGDFGWVIRRHGEVYAREYGWDERFEAIVAGIVARFIGRYDPKRERCWIAEHAGEKVGSVFLVKKTSTIGQLRLLLVEPKARGLGIGSSLVSECTRAARQFGYRKLTLWTDVCLVAARRLYERYGFQLVREEPHSTFGVDLVGQVWDLKL